MRYYLQTHEGKQSLRRYHGATRQRWTLEGWSSECAPESTCLATGDRRIDEPEAQLFIEGAA